MKKKTKQTNTTEMHIPPFTRAIILMAKSNLKFYRKDTFCSLCGFKSGSYAHFQI